MADPITPFYSDDWLTLYGGDCREVLASLPADSVDCVVTSPPYFSLRDYGVAGQIGLEASVEEYVETMVAVFREVRRVCKPTATVWLNLGDSFLPGKQMAGVPWRVAFALQADGWYLRSDVIWSKPNPMPESVTDRPTKSHEYLFLLTKSARYYFDADAVREGDDVHYRKAVPTGRNTELDDKKRPGWADHVGFKSRELTTVGRNIRSVWTIATRPYPGAHFAVFPPELPERCIKAGSSERGVCPECGAPWERVVERGEPVQHHWAPGTQSKRRGNGKLSSVLETGMIRPKETTGWAPSCIHSAGEANPGPEMGRSEGNADGDIAVNGPRATSPAVILDPFGGSGTVGMVANRLSRRAILIDLNPSYLRQQMERNAQTPLGLTEGDAA